MRVHFSGWTLDSDARELRRGTDPVHLSPKAFRLLEVLIEHRPSAVSKERLFEIVWPKIVVDENNLPTVVKEIRSALDDNAREPRFIHTVFGHGYKFAADATVETVPQPKLKSVAVLPFSNKSDPESDYVSDGIADGLLNALAGLRSLRVVPRSTAFRYRGSDIDLRTAAREMDVEAIVSGRVEVRGGEVTIQVELINTKSDSQIWGERFHARTSELLDLQKRMESEIVPRIAEQAGSHNAEVPTRNADAFDFFLRGQHQSNLRDTDSLRRAVEAFSIATELDPNYALAHAALAEAYVTIGSRETEPPRDIFPLAESSAKRALSINRSIAAAHTALAGVQELFKRDWLAAEESHRTAVKNEPQYASARHWFALHYARRGEHDEAKRWIDSAIKLEPRSAIIHTNAAFVAYLAHDFTSALELGLTALELAPHFEAAHNIRGVAYIQIDPSRAIDELEEAARLSRRQPYTMMHLASAYAAAGDAFAARRIREEVRTVAENRFVSSAVLAMLEIAVGNLNGALDAFETAARQRSPWLSYFLCEPRLDVLRSEPRFQSLVASLGFGSAATLNP